MKVDSKLFFGIMVNILDIKFTTTNQEKLC